MASNVMAIGSSSQLSRRFERLAGFDFLDAIGFDTAAYLTLHPDLASLNLSPLDAKAHYLAHGVFERRRVSFAGSLAQVAEAIKASNLTSDQKRVLSLSLAQSHISQLNDLAHLPGALVPGFGYRPVLVCGDSHISLFTRENYKERNGFMFVPFCCWGASARGLPKLISHMNYGSMILSVLKDCLTPMKASNAPILFMFGQNDIEFVYYFKRAADGDKTFSIDHFKSYCEQTIERFMLFLQQVREVVDQSTQIVIAGIMPPTLNDEYIFGNQKATMDLAWAADIDDFDNLRWLLSDLEVPNWHQRTEMHRHYNIQVEATSKKEGFLYLDIFDLTLSENGVVARPFILGQDGKDHHFDFYSFYTDLLSGEVARELHRVLNSRSSDTR